MIVSLIEAQSCTPQKFIYQGGLIASILPWEWTGQGVQLVDTETIDQTNGDFQTILCSCGTNPIQCKVAFQRRP